MTVALSFAIPQSIWAQPIFDNADEPTQQEPEAEHEEEPEKRSASAESENKEPEPGHGIFAITGGYNSYSSTATITASGFGQSVSASVTGTINYLPVALTFGNLTPNSFGYLVNAGYDFQLSQPSYSTSTSTGISLSVPNNSADFKQEALFAELFIGYSPGNFLIGAGPVMTSFLDAKVNGQNVSDDKLTTMGLGIIAGYKVVSGGFFMMPSFVFGYQFINFGEAADALNNSSSTVNGVSIDTSLTQTYFQFNLAVGFAL